jgi:hypothetical protein
MISSEIQNYYFDEAGHAVARRMATEFVAAFQFLFSAMRDYLIGYKPGTDPLEIVTIAPRQPGHPCDPRTTPDVKACPKI